MGSSRRRCCCGKPEGCARCTTPTTFFGVPSSNEWCNIVYGFTLSNILLPEIKSNYEVEDYLLVVKNTSEGSGCDCDPTFNPGTWPFSGGITLFYDVNLLINAGGNVVDPSFVGCTYDNRSVFTFDPATRDVITYLNFIGMRPSPCPQYYYDPILGITYDCGIIFVPTDIEAFVAPAYSVIQHTNAAFSCQFRACGFNSSVGGVYENNLPPQFCDPYNLIFNQNCPNQFAVGVTFFHADSYILKSVTYAPVIRTLDEIIPIPTPDCFYSLEEEEIIPGSSNIKTSVLRTCYVPTLEEECRCQSAIVITLTGRAEQQYNKFIFEEEQIVGPGGELEGNRNFIAVGTTTIVPGDEGYTPPLPLGKCEIRLYYIGCIDDAIYGLPSPSERVFTLDAGTFYYRGVYDSLPCGLPGYYFNPPRVCTYDNINLENLPQFDICPNRPVICRPQSLSGVNTRVLPASFFVDLGMPQQITVKRLS